MIVRKGFAMKRVIGVLGLLFLTACVEVVALDRANLPSANGKAAVDPYMPVAIPEMAALSLGQVVARVEPVVRGKCRQRAVSRCDFRILIDDRPNQPANAYQTLDANGRPILGFTVALLRNARNQDELAFVMGHEAAHHIAGHIPQAQQTALAGAVLAGVLAATAGASSVEIEKAQNVAANLAVSAYGKDFELEADALGAEIAYEAGFDPIRGSAFFDQLPDPSDRFLGTHPANGRRKAVVAQTVARLKAGG
jgi:predicted Zn-dependent protease